MMQGLEATQQRLRGILYRFDCPTPLTLGEYVLDLLAMPTRTRLARHVLECELCDEELHAAREFLSTDLVPQTPGVWRGLHRVVATLLMPTPQGAFATTRGEQSGGAEYRAGPITIVIGDVRGRRRGTVSIDGLILHAFAPPAALADRAVALLDTVQSQVHATRTDDLGSFAFEDVATGKYRLEVTLAEEVIVVEDVRIGG